MSWRRVAALVLLIGVVLASVLVGSRRTVQDNNALAPAEGGVEETAAREHASEGAGLGAAPAHISADVNTGGLAASVEGRAIGLRPSQPLREPLHPITKAIIDQLASESLAESLENLWEGEPFDFPSAGLGGATIHLRVPLEPKDGQEARDYLSIWTNRRVLKFVQELSGMPKDEAGRLVAAQIEHNLSLYADLLDEQDARRNAPEGSMPTSGDNESLVTKVSDGPNLHYTRLSLSALTSVAGVLHLASAADAVADVVRLAMQQREYYYDYASHGLTEDQAWWPLALIGLYCPSILTTGLVGTGVVSAGDADEIVSPTTYWTERDLTAWNVESIVDDVMAAGPPDFSKGQTTISFAINVDDERFDRLLGVAGLKPPEAQP